MKWKENLSNPDERVFETVKSVLLHWNSISFEGIEITSPPNLVAVLRTTFTKRDKVPGWFKARDKLIEFADQGLIAQNELIGLRDVKECNSVVQTLMGDVIIHLSLKQLEDDRNV